MRRSRRSSVAALAVATLLLSACGGSPGPSAAKTPSPSPSPAASPAPSAGPSPTPSPAPPPDYGAPPAGVELFYVQVPGWPAWLIGYDWAGRPRATVHLKEAETSDNTQFGISVAPNGAGFVAGQYTFDRNGKLIFQYPITGKGGDATTWSEDGTVLCGVSAASTMTDPATAAGYTDYYFIRRTPTTSTVTVSRFLHVDGIPGDMGFDMYACTNWLDRALAIKTVCCGIWGATTLRISDGAVLGTWTRSGGGPVFSPDGQLVADPVVDGAGNTLSTTVGTVLGGVVIGRYGAGVTFRAFSRDNRYAVVQVGGSSGPIAQVIQVSTRRVVWQDSTSRPINSVWARPDGGDLAVAFTAQPYQVDCNSSVPCRNPQSNVVVIHPDGSSVSLGGDFLASVQPWS